MEDSDEPGGPCNSKAALDEKANYSQPQYGRKLTFSEKCGLAIALRTVPHKPVREAFNLSRATVSLLAHALEPGRNHYREIREQFELMGEDAFRERYYTPELHFRLKRVLRELTHLPGGETDLAPRTFGFDPRAKKYEGWHTLPDGMRFHVSKPVTVERLGWYFKLDADNTWRGAESERGAADLEPFRTSSEAFDAAHKFWGYESPRPKPGRPKINHTLSPKQSLT